jgi:acyltransferase-like protein
VIRDKLISLKVPQALDQFYRRYFQTEFLGEDNLKMLENQNALLVMNHTAFFALECYILGSRILSDYPQSDLKGLVWKGFTEGPAGFWFKTMGGQTAKISTGTKLLSQGKTVLIMPEGVDATDVRKRFNTFHTGYLRMLQHENVPIIPIGFSGVDESIPWIVARNRFIEEKLMKPVNPDFNFVLMPKLPIFRPTKIVFNIGKPIKVPAADISSEKGLTRWNKQLKQTIEGLVYDADQHREDSITSSKINNIFHNLVGGKTTFLGEH